jgi:hypothetical protein
MKIRPLVVRVCAFVAVFTVAAGSLMAQPTIYSDTVGDIATNISTGGGTLDIVKMEVSDTTTDVIFNLTVNGNIANVNWGNFMVGISTGATTNTNTGNGWNRPIQLNSPAGGMTRWVGSWVNGSGGSQIWGYTGTNWSTNLGGLPSYTFATNTNGTSTINYTVSKASLGTTNLGDVLYFDAYSSGGGGTDSAVDSLANPNVSITAWNQAYTSGGTNPLNSYTLANSASFITNTVTFSVDMNVQESIGTFFPDFDTVSVAGAWNGFTAGDTNYVLVEDGTNGIYTNTFQIPGVYDTSVPYKFAINTTLETSPNRTFAAGTNPAPPPLILPTVFYNDNPGFRNVTFSVDMSVQEAQGIFTNGNTVLVTGAFNNWDTSGASNNILTNGGGTNPVYTGTISNIGGAPGANLPYKFYSLGMPNSGYENISDRQLTLGPVGSNQVLSTVFWNNQTNVPASRPVSFSVDMTVQVANGNFDTNSGVVRVIGNFNGQNYETGNTNYNLTNAGSNIYVGEFAVTGDAGTTNQYKFYSPGFPVNNGYEIINPNDIFENRTWVLGVSNVLQTLPLVFWSNDNGGATFTSWAQGAPLNTTNLSLYAVGGASGPTNNNSIPSVTLVTSNTLSITAIVRTNNPSLSVVGRTTTDLANGPWTTNSVTQSNAVDQSGVPFGTARQIFSTPRTSTNQFLGIEAVLQP